MMHGQKNVKKFLKFTIMLQRPAKSPSTILEYIYTYLTELHVSAIFKHFQAHCSIYVCCVEHGNMLRCMVPDDSAYIKLHTPDSTNIRCIIFCFINSTGKCYTENLYINYVSHMCMGDILERQIPL
jgi:hypothetical protein